jgi:hypothetical protein
MLAITDEQRSLIESGAAVSVGTRSADLVPDALRAWGPRVSADRRSIEVFVDRPNSQRCVENLQDNGRIAMCFVDVITFHALQLKGRCVEIGDPGPDDWAWIDRHRAGFTEETGKIGFVAEVVRNLWSTQVVRLRFVVEEFFDQSPGPGAGRAIVE